MRRGLVLVVGEARCEAVDETQSLDLARIVPDHHQNLLGDPADDEDSRFLIGEGSFVSALPDPALVIIRSPVVTEYQFSLAHLLVREMPEENAARTEMQIV